VRIIASIPDVEIYVVGNIFQCLVQKKFMLVCIFGIQIFLATLVNWKDYFVLASTVAVLSRLLQSHMPGLIECGKNTLSLSRLVMQVWYSFLDEFKALKKKSAPFKHYGDKGGIYDDKNYIPLTVVDAIQKEGGSKNANQMMI